MPDIEKIVIGEAPANEEPISGTSPFPEESPPAAQTPSNPVPNEERGAPEIIGEEVSLSDSAKLDAIMASVTAMREDFDLKIKVDEHKNTMFDNMHRELTDFRNGVVDKNVELMAKDIIPLVDRYEKIAESLPNREGDTEYTTAKEAIQNLVEDLIDVLYRQDVERFTSIDDSMTVNTKSQRILKGVETSNPDLHNKVCAQLAPGYSRGEKILRAEQISIYKYKGEE